MLKELFKRREKESLSLLVISELCIGCGRCADRCRSKAIRMKYTDDRGVAVLYHPEWCTGCGRCVSTCSTMALELLAI